MKKRLIIILSFILAFAFISTPADAKRKKSDEPEIKYVFYMIGDGMGINQLYGTELYNRATGKGPENINFLHFPERTIVTSHSASSLVPDSAAAGTSLSTGHKTNAGCLGVDSEMNKVSNIAEWAKEKGYGTGVATTVGINHATPSAFYAHLESRYMYSAIVAEYINSDLDFLAGAGLYTDKKGGPGVKEMEKNISEAGITILRGSAAEGAENVQGRLLCLSGKDQQELAFAIDQDEDDTNLSDFVKAGIEYLDRNYGKKGFFFMVEGGKIDYANHSNDAVGAFHETNDFAAAIDLALEFYNEHPDETLIVVSSDHETSGMILGAGKYKMNPERLAWQNESEYALTQKYRKQFSEKAPTWEEVKAFLSENLGLWTNVEVNKSFEKELKATVEEMSKTGKSNDVQDLYAVNSKIVYDAVVYLANKSGFSWAISSHSGSPVGLFVLGPKAEAFNACQDHTDIPKTIAKVAGY